VSVSFLTDYPRSYGNKAVAYALWKPQERGRTFVNAGDPVHEGMIVGIHSGDNDLVVNPSAAA
jgi:GTP-binding protein